jgi:hypothetical protein
MSFPSVSVVVPALNEARNIPHVFARMPADIHQVVLVDGRSVDDTVAVARQIRPDVHVVSQTRRGKGNALACGFEAATGDVIAMVDADGSADPAEIPRFVEALLDGADFAKGTRFSAGGGSSDITRLRGYGNRILTTFFNVCYGRRYSDLCYGFNVFWRSHVPVLGLDATSPPPVNGARLWGDGFEVETLIHVRAAKAGLLVAEVPSFEHSRIHGVSNLNATQDGLRVLRIILAELRGARHSAAAAAIPPANRRLELTSTSPQSGNLMSGSLDELEPRGGPAAMDIDDLAERGDIASFSDARVTRADLAPGASFVAAGNGTDAAAGRPRRIATKQFSLFLRNQATRLTDASSPEEGPVR